MSLKGQSSNASQRAQRTENDLRQQLQELLKENEVISIRLHILGILSHLLSLLLLFMQEMHISGLMDTSSTIDGSETVLLSKDDWKDGKFASLESAHKKLLEELENARKVEEDLLNTLEETQAELHQAQALLKEAEAKAYNDMAETVQKVQRMSDGLTRLTEENRFSRP